jgi:hypothetical protein
MNEHVGEKSRHAMAFPVRNEVGLEGEISQQVAE